MTPHKKLNGNNRPLAVEFTGGTRSGMDMICAVCSSEHTTPLPKRVCPRCYDVHAKVVARLQHQQPQAFPTEISIGPFTIHIVLVDASTKPEGHLSDFVGEEQFFGVLEAIRRVSPSGDCFGIFNASAMTVFLAKHLPLRRKIQVLAHEIGHAWAKIYTEDSSEVNACDYAMCILTMTPIFAALQAQLDGES